MLKYIKNIHVSDRIDNIFLNKRNISIKYAIIFYFLFKFVM